MNTKITPLIPTGKQHELIRAKIIKRTLGTFTAARYLALRGWSLEASMWTLARSSPTF